MYDPTIGQFISEDPIGFDDGGTNMYEYCGNSPTNATDPTGTHTITLSGAQAALAVQLQLQMAEEDQEDNPSNNTPTFVNTMSNFHTPPQTDPLIQSWIDGAGCDTPQLRGNNLDDTLAFITKIMNSMPDQHGNTVARDVSVLQFIGHERKWHGGITIGDKNCDDIDRGAVGKMNGGESGGGTPVKDPWLPYYIDAKNAREFALQLKRHVRFARPGGHRPIIILGACNLGLFTALDKDPKNPQSVAQIIANTLDADVTYGGFGNEGFKGGLTGNIRPPQVTASYTLPGGPVSFQALIGSYAESNQEAKNTLDALNKVGAPNSANDLFMYTTPD
jgi:hypothetical protein